MLDPDEVVRESVYTSVIACHNARREYEGLGYEVIMIDDYHIKIFLSKNQRKKYATQHIKLKNKLKKEYGECKMFEKMKFKKELKNQGFPWKEISIEAIQQYQQQISIHEDEDEDLWTMQKKINRNWYLGTTSAFKDGYIKKSYGNLELVCNVETGVIEKIINYKTPHRGYRVNAIDKKILNELYEL